MADESRRQQILEALKARVEAIIAGAESTPGGAVYQTSAGLHVYLGEEPGFGPDDPDLAIAIVVGDEEPGYQGENIFINLPIGFRVLAKASLDEPWTAVEAVIADVKRAVEQPDRTLGGLVKRQIQRGAVSTLQREAGSLAVGAVSVYRAPYLEMWGNP